MKYHFIHISTTELTGEQICQIISAYFLGVCINENFSCMNKLKSYNLNESMGHDLMISNSVNSVI